MGILMEAAVDTSAVSKVITDLQTAALPIVGAGVALGAAIFGILFIWRKARAAMGS